MAMSTPVRYNQLRKCNLLPPRYALKFAKLVCTCSGDGHDKSLNVTFTPESLDTLKSWTLQCMTTWLCTDLSKIIPIVKQIVAHTKVQSESCIAVGNRGGHLAPNFLYCLEALVNERYELFTVKRDCDGHTPKPDFEEAVQLLVDGLRFPGLIVGKKGHRVKPICKRYKSTIRIKFGSSHASSFQATVRASSRSDLVACKSALLTTVAEVRRRSEANHNRILKIQQRRQLAMYNVSNQFQRLNLNKGKSQVLDTKTAATEHYERKKQGEIWKEEERNNKKPTPVLENGRCRHCLSVYRKGDQYNGACRYHKGYLVAKKTGYRWSCCRRKVSERRPSAESHLKDGCCRGLHNWRLSKHSPVKLGRGRSNCRGNPRHVRSCDLEKYY
ncbi:uncharacterized protein [Ptychodera flava]|uniref:uncharacterized protein n=1 Tax=Ptychodera flava TaxID=63121 RepID=UPI00396A5F55